MNRDSIAVSKQTILRVACLNDLPQLEEIRAEAFAPIFQSFQNILGEKIYAHAQKAEDESQKQLLESMFAEDSEWFICVLIQKKEAIGFVSYKLDHGNKVGEIGLNAIRPKYAGGGLGTRMYKAVLEILRDEHMEVATVATGGDPSHAPARVAYERAGFNVQIPSVWYCKEL